jgi:hypothetical protein
VIIASALGRKTQRRWSWSWRAGTSTKRAISLFFALMHRLGKNETALPYQRTWHDLESVNRLTQPLLRNRSTDPLEISVRVFLCGHLFQHRHFQKLSEVNASRPVTIGRLRYIHTVEHFSLSAGTSIVRPISLAPSIFATIKPRCSRGGSLPSSVFSCAGANAMTAAEANQVLAL